MNSKSTRRQHYIPVMILKNFCDERGFLWVSDGQRTYKANPINVFAERDLYAKSNIDHAPNTHSYEDFVGSIEKSNEHETRLSEIESEAAPAIMTIINKARQGKCPALSSRLRDVWKRFFITTALRTQESQERIPTFKNFDDAFYEAATIVAKTDEFQLPDKDTLYSDSRNVHLKNILKSNTAAKFATGDDPRLQAQIEEFCRNRGLLIAVIQIPQRSFVVGSHGLAIVENSNGEQTAWLPIAHDVAICTTAFPDTEYLIPLTQKDDGDRIITMINKTLAKQSWLIAGESETLVRSLTQGQPEND